MSETGRGGAWRAAGASAICCGLLWALSLNFSHHPLFPRSCSQLRLCQKASRSRGELGAELGQAGAWTIGPSVVPGRPGRRSEVSVTETQRDRSCEPERALEGFTHHVTREQDEVTICGACGALTHTCCLHRQRAAEHITTL